MNNLLNKDIEKLFPNIIERMKLIDTLTYLPYDLFNKIDGASMYNSQDLGVPFLDNNVVKKTMKTKINTKNKEKLYLKKILFRNIPKQLFNRPKIGFGAKIGKILTIEFNFVIEAFIFSKGFKNQNIFKIAEYREKYKENINGKRNWQFPLRNLLVFKFGCRSGKNRL